MRTFHVSLWMLCILMNIHIEASSLYYCSSKDPCSEANSTALFEPFARSENCKYDQDIGFCDRYIDPGWYRVDDEMLDHCPELLSCGTLYPIWLNDTLPLESDGIVTRSACKVGFNNCCIKTYNIQVKHCSTFYAYCLGSLDGCAERYCFGVNGTCYVPTTTTQTTTTVIVTKTTTSGCHKDPCLDGNVRTLDDQYSRSENCEYNPENSCNRHIDQGWYKSKSPMLDHCPTLLSCGAVYPIWLNGSIPNVNEGVVSRTACKRGSSGCCDGTYDVHVKNCGSYLAYCLSQLVGCREGYCFGENESCERQKMVEIDTVSYLAIVLVPALLFMVILFITFLVYFKSMWTKNGCKNSFCKRNISLSEMAPASKRQSQGSFSEPENPARNESQPPPYDFVQIDDKKTRIDNCQINHSPLHLKS